MIWTAVGPSKKWRVEYAYLLQLILFIYIPGKLMNAACALGVLGGELRLIVCAGSYILFTHMMSQRRKVMKGKGKQT